MQYGKCELGAEKISVATIPGWNTSNFCFGSDVVMSKKTKIKVMHSSHLDLFWMGSQETCLDWGAKIIDNAAEIARNDENFHFLIETVRFLEYLFAKYPDNVDFYRKLFKKGQLEITADYVDRLENSHDGECMVRNVLMAKKKVKQLLGSAPRVCFHPDLPGTAEQMPQVLKKSGVDYYLGARGFAPGARFFWKGLDKSRIIMYNFPQHYSYYSLEDDVIRKIDRVKEAIASDTIAVCLSGGDLGAADTFFLKTNSGGARVNLREYIAQLAEKYPEFEFSQANIVKTLDEMDTSALDERHGENPSRWGHHASALHVKMMMLDKQVSAALTDAEKLCAISELLGNPVSISFKKHPLAHSGSSGGKRKYVELRTNPETLHGWFEEAWKYQLITQDHNYGGVDGAQTQFDRFCYKNAALRIAEEAKQTALKHICSCIPAQKNDMCVFNTMNWKRDGRVFFKSEALDPNKTYAAVDDQGIRFPVIRKGDEFMFVASGVPSMGYKSYRIIEESAIINADGCKIRVNDNVMELSNEYIKVSVDRKTGAVLQMLDKTTGIELAGNNKFGTVCAYIDNSVSVDDNVVDKPLLDESEKHVRDVSVCCSHPYGATVRVTTEILNCKMTLDITLMARKREVILEPTIYWAGYAHRQIKLNLDINDFSHKRLYYGVPYGAQMYGKPLEDGINFKKDEISDELYKRYREVEKWFAVEDDGHGVVVASNHSAYEFLKDGIRALLIRCVPNCGDTGVIFHNTGIQQYCFVIKPYDGKWQDGPYKAGWELAYPLISTSLHENTESLSSRRECSFIDTGDTGILTVFKKEEEGGYSLRIFDTTGLEKRLEIRNELGLKLKAVTDLELNECSDAKDILEAFEIKTMLFDKE